MSLSKKVTKLPWTPETVELLLRYIKDYKTKCVFGGVDFQAMTSGFRDFIGRHSSIDNPTHVEGYLMTLLQPSLHVNRPLAGTNIFKAGSYNMFPQQVKEQ